jgi:hypothetical protein
MKRWLFTCAAVVPMLGLLGAPLVADVKTREKTQFKLEGMLGRMVGMFGGKGAREGIVGTSAVKGNRKVTVSGNTGQIVDLGEEKLYDVDYRKKEYTVTTFEEMRKRIREQQEKAKEQAAREEGRQEEKEKPQQPQKEYEFDFDAKETGQTRQIAGFDTRQVIMTVTMREKGKTLEQGGGFVMASDSWLGPEIPALKELADFDMRYYKQLYGEEALALGVDQMAMILAAYPMIGKASQRLKQEGDKLKGTPLSSVTTFEVVKTPEQLAQEKEAQQGSGGGGIGGMLARKMMKKEEPKARALVLTLNHEYQEVSNAVAPADIDLPADFKQKK